MKNKLIVMSLFTTILLISGCSFEQPNKDKDETTPKINEYYIRCPEDVNFYFVATSGGTIKSLTIEGPGSGNCTIRQVKNTP